MAIEPLSAPNPTSPVPRAIRAASAGDRLAELFPERSTDGPSWWRRRRRALVAIVVVALIGSSLLAVRAFGAESAGYRTATVATHDVDAILNGVASVEPVSQASVAFPAAGTVSSVSVSVGDTVAAGQTLASLDPKELNQTLHEKEAALAQAELVLTKALNGESVSGSSGGSGGSTPQSSGSASATTNSAGANSVTLTAASRSTSASVAAAQQAVLTAQKQVDATLDASTKALASAATVCAAAGVGSTTSSAATTEALTACQTATKAVATAQANVNTAQKKLSTASNALDTLLGQEAAAASSGTSADSTATANGSGAPSSDSTPSGASTSPSSADLASYQKAVDAAEAEVAVAQQAIAQATIASPIAGKVEAVNIAAGDSVTAASSTANIVIVGAGGYEVTTTVSVDEVTDVKVGQEATFLPDGSKKALDGTVTSISITPDTDASTTSYRVVVALDESHAQLNNGSTGSIAIVTKSSRAALAVPTSAVTTTGSRHTVSVVDGSTTRRVSVEVGVVGATWTEITSGVKAGQRVALADLSEPLPGSATDSSSSSTSGSGTGGPPAGFPTGGSFPGQ